MLFMQQVVAARTMHNQTATGQMTLNRITQHRIAAMCIFDIDTFRSLNQTV
ncbi:Uncharacterised protein [Mycobacteroides abscessus]|nr:Uncharacterised protein [Mycobacteroides abscessus]